MILRDCLWKSPSIVSIPSPSSGIRSPKPPSRQRNVVEGGDEHEVVRLRPEHEDVAGVEDPQREDRAVALVGLEQQPQRVDDHAVRAAHARRVVARADSRRGPGARLQLEGDAPQRVGADRLRPGQRRHLPQLTLVKMPPRLPVTGVSELVLEVQDLERSEAFYAGLLGPAGGRALEGAEAIWVMAATAPGSGCGGRRSGSRAARAARTCTSRCTSRRPTTTPRWSGCARRASRCRSTFGTTHGRAAYATDPDGHVVELWTWDVSGHLATLPTT